MALFAFRQTCEGVMGAARAYIVGAASLLMGTRKIPPNSAYACATLNEEDDRRKTLILNAILIFSIAFLVILEMTILCNQYSHGISYNGLSSNIFFGAILVHILLFALAKSGRAKIAAYILVAFYVGIALYCGWIWGASLPATLLAIAWSAVASSVLIRPAYGPILAISLSIALCGLALHETAQPTVPPWRFEKTSVTDIITYASILIFISYISWLSNREIRRSLERARLSEQMLARERNELELRVAERTSSFMTSERERVEGLERAASFGELARGIVHDMINPLTAICLHIERVSQKSNAFKDIQPTTERLVQLSKNMSAHLSTVRLNIERGASTKILPAKTETADIRSEILIVKDALVHLMRPRGAVIRLDSCDCYYIPIHPIRAHQIFVNIAKNALDAGAQHIVFRTKIIGNILHIIIENDGASIPAEDSQRIFETGYTTKQSTGVGLPTVKHIVEHTLRGEISVTSSPGSTEFIIKIPYESRPHDQADFVRPGDSTTRTGEDTH